MQLTKDELEELDRLWSEMARRSLYGSPPTTDDEATVAGLDALFAGVISGAGRIDPAGLDAFQAVVSSSTESAALQSILDRVAAFLGLGGDAQRHTRS